MTEKCSDFCQDDLADDDIMLLDNGQEVRPLLTLPMQGVHPFVNGNSEDRGRESWVPPETPSAALPTGLYVGGDPDKPGGDQAESEGLPGERAEGRLRLAPEGWKACPGLTPVLLPGVHPAHARQGA